MEIKKKKKFYLLHLDGWRGVWGYKPTENSDISYYILWNAYPRGCLNSFDCRTLTNFFGDFLIKFHSLILSVIP